MGTGTSPSRLSPGGPTHSICSEQPGLPVGTTLAPHPHPYLSCDAGKEPPRAKVGGGEPGALTLVWLQGADVTQPSATETHMPGPSISPSSLASPHPHPPLVRSLPARHLWGDRSFLTPNKRLLQSPPSRCAEGPAAKRKQTCNKHGVWGGRRRSG